MKFAFYILLSSLPFALLQLMAIFMAYQLENGNRCKANLLRVLCWVMFFAGLGLAFYLFAEYRLFVKIGICVLSYLLGRLLFQISFGIYVKKVLGE